MGIFLERYWLLEGKKSLMLPRGRKWWDMGGEHYENVADKHGALYVLDEIWRLSRLAKKDKKGKGKSNWITWHLICSGVASYKAGELKKTPAGRKWLKKMKIRLTPYKEKPKAPHEPTFAELRKWKR